MRIPFIWKRIKEVQFCCITVDKDAYNPKTAIFSESSVDSMHTNFCRTRVVSI